MIFTRDIEKAESYMIEKGKLLNSLLRVVAVDEGSLTPGYYTNRFKILLKQEIITEVSGGYKLRDEDLLLSRLFHRITKKTMSIPKVKKQIYSFVFEHISEYRLYYRKSKNVKKRLSEEIQDCHEYSLIYSFIYLSYFYMPDFMEQLMKRLFRKIYKRMRSIFEEISPDEFDSIYVTSNFSQKEVQNKYMR